MGTKFKNRYIRWKDNVYIIDFVICIFIVILTFNALGIFVEQASKGIFAMDAIISPDNYRKNRLKKESKVLIHNIQTQSNIMNMGEKFIKDNRNLSNSNIIGDGFFIGYLYIIKDKKDENGKYYYITNRSWLAEQIDGGADINTLFENLHQSQGVIWYSVDNKKNFNEVNSMDQNMLTPEVKKNIENITEYYFIKADYYENFIIKSRMLFITYILNLSLVILIIIKYEELIKRKGNRFIIEGIYKSKFGETMYYLKETPKRLLRNINKGIVKFTISLIIFNIAIEILATSKFFTSIDSVINLFTNRYIDSLIMTNKLVDIINFSSILFYIGYFIFCILRNYIFVYELLDIVREFKNGNMNIKLTYTDKREMNEIVEGIKYIQEEYKIIAEERIKNEQLKTELISNVSHDLKTPLTSIINYVNILDRDDITYEERKQYLKILGTKSQRLQGLIEDLFEMSKFNSGKINLDKYEVDIVQLVHMVIGEQEDKLKEKGLTTRIISYSESVFIQIDPDKMVRVFDNLIVNAIKYSLANTRIYIDIFDDGNWVTISTKNISSYEMNFKPEDMMERFVRGDRSRNSNVEGSGLGLAIARSIVEMHDGDLKLEVEGDMFKTYVMLKK